MKTKQKLILVTIGTMAAMSFFTYATLNGSFPLVDNRAIDAKEAAIGPIAEIGRAHV